jgi:sporulation protein YlmC with PRC-barrel domain
METHEGPIGHVTDFVLDVKNWAISHLVIETGQWLCSKEIVISPKQIERISYNESKIFVRVTREAILKAPEYHVPPVGV